MTQSDEQARIERIRELLSRSSSDVLLGIGDDAAVLSPSSGKPVLSVDAIVEGVHFRRDWLSFEQIGRRAYVTAVSDLAAMGARPRAALLSLVLPPDVDDEALYAIVRGAGRGADEHAAPIVGGNLARGTELSITTTVVGDASERFLRREGARVGDHVFVTGTLGAAALGVTALSRGRGAESAFAPFVARYGNPTAQTLVGLRLVGLATACADVSDGLVADLGHVCVASSVGARIYAAELPFAPGLEDAARSLGADGMKLALVGGEDYELVFTAPASTTAAELATRIGEVTAGSGVVVLDRDGATIDVGAGGFSHF